jgi:hypothetical protein
MPKEDIVGKVIGIVNKPMNRLVEEVYKRTPNGYTKGERESMEDDAAQRYPNYYGKESKMPRPWKDLIGQESSKPGVLGTSSRRDEIVDAMGGQVEIKSRSRQRTFKRTPEYAKTLVGNAKFDANRNSGDAKPPKTAAKVTPKQAAGAMSPKGVSPSLAARAKTENLQKEMAAGRRAADEQAASQSNEDKVASWNRNNARVATKTLQKDMAKGMTKARAASAKPAPSMRSLMGMPKAK